MTQTISRPSPKYQIFISSTYSDLRDERNTVAWEILRLGHIPVGMELFQAADDRGWQTIKNAIDHSDYYILLVSGRYGTIDPTTGISWTEREYQYAKSQKLKTLAFIRSDEQITRDKMDTDAHRIKRLREFINIVQNTHLCAQWSTSEDLKSKIVLAVLNAINEDQTSGRPRAGWFRGDQVPTLEVSNELARLSSENATLRTKLDTVSQERQPCLQLGPVAK